MPKFTVRLVTDVPVYWDVEIEAVDADAASAVALHYPFGEPGDTVPAEAGMLHNAWYGETHHLEYDWEADRPVTVDAISSP